MAQQLQDDELVSALRAAHIPKVYQRPEVTLAQHSQGLPVLAWLKDNPVRSLRQGMGWFYAGSTPPIMATFYATARAMVVQGMSVYVTDLPHLRERLWGADFDDYREFLESITCLFVAGFHEPHYREAFTAKELYSLEWYFRRRMDNQQPIFFQASTGIKACGWWSKPFLGVVAERNQEVV